MATDGFAGRYRSTSRTLGLGRLEEAMARASRTVRHQFAHRYGAVPLPMNDPSSEFIIPPGALVPFGLAP
jgi:hypothetical protein